jgi:hypothetical protein
MADVPPSGWVHTRRVGEDTRAVTRSPARRGFPRILGADVVGQVDSRAQWLLGAAVTVTAAGHGAAVDTSSTVLAGARVRIPQRVRDGQRTVPDMAQEG